MNPISEEKVNYLFKMIIAKIKNGNTNFSNQEFLNVHKIRLFYIEIYTLKLKMNILENFLDFNEFTDLSLLVSTKYTTITLGKKKISPSPKIIFKTFNYLCNNSKSQKIFLDTFSQIKRQKNQYLQIYDCISFVTFNSTLNPTFSMPYISSTNLEFLFQSSNFVDTWTSQDALHCIFAVANGLECLHDNLFYHGNLNPSNIICDEAKQCYLCDFGLYPIKNLYINYSEMYNNDYKDPNLINSEPDDKNDIYSFGVLMFQLCYIFFVSQNDKKTNDLVIKLNTNMLKYFPPFFSDLISSCIDLDITKRPSIKEIIKKFQNSEYKDLYNKFVKVIYIENLADLGNDFALNQLGEMYEEGEIYEKNHEKALLCYQKAASKNNSEAQSNYGVLLQEYSDKSDKNKKEGAHYLKLSAEQGNINGMANYGIALKTGDGVEPDLKKALEYLKKSADLGSAYAQVNYGYTLLDNKPTEEQINEGLKYIKMAINQNYTDAIYTYGILLKVGDVIEQNEKLAMKYFKMAADKGYNEAMYEYAKGYYYGQGVPQNDEIALNYFKLAYENGNKKAKRQMNFLLKSKSSSKEDSKLQEKIKSKPIKTEVILINEEKDPNKLLSLFKTYKNEFKESSDQSDLSKYNLFKFEDEFIQTKNDQIIYKYGKIYDNNRSNKESIQKAMKYYKMSADLGNAKAQATYGVALQNGKEITQDLELGFKYLEKSANQGDLNGMSNYALALYNGDGTEKNTVQGLKYLKKAADLGNLFAQLNYGICAKDPVVGHQYFEKLVNMNFKKAFFYYARDYLEGHGVKKDIVKAESIFHQLYDMEGKTKVLIKLIECLKEINFQEALNYMKILADSEDPNFANEIKQAQFRYGIELFNGKNIKKNIPKSINYLKKSNQTSKIKKDYPNIYVFYSHDYNEIKTKVDHFLSKYIVTINEAEKELIEKVFTGDIESIFEAAKIMEKMKDFSTSNYFYQISAEFNQSEALFILGKNYIEGKNELNISLKKGKEYLKKAAELGNLDAKLELIKHQFKTSFKNLGNKFIVYNLLPDITELASKNMIPAIILKAKFLAITESFNEAKEELKKALSLSQNNSHFLYKIGKLYVLFVKEENFGLQLIEKSCKDELKASYFLGKYYFDNRNKSEKFNQKAGHFLKIAAEKNIKNSRLLLRNYNLANNIEVKEL